MLFRRAWSIDCWTEPPPADDGSSAVANMCLGSIDLRRCKRGAEGEISARAKDAAQIARATAYFLEDGLLAKVDPVLVLADPGLLLPAADDPADADERRRHPLRLGWLGSD
jgi:hypothetical protein